MNGSVPTFVTAFPRDSSRGIRNFSGYDVDVIKLSALLAISDEMLTISTYLF